jgi:hypothetical protein
MSSALIGGVTLTSCDRILLVHYELLEQLEPSVTRFNVAHFALGRHRVTGGQGGDALARHQAPYRLAVLAQTMCSVKLSNHTAEKSEPSCPTRSCESHRSFFRASPAVRSVPDVAKSVVQSPVTGTPGGPQSMDHGARSVSAILNRARSAHRRGWRKVAE